MKKSIIVLKMAAVMFALFSCKSTHVQENIEGKTWELFAVNGVEAKAGDFSRDMPTITFGADKSVSGHSGCNSYKGTYTLDDKGALTFSEVMSTKMYCPGDGESNFMKAFAKADKIVVEGSKLKLLDDSHEVLTFVQKK